MLDAYAVRKAIPRVLIAVIAINLSIYLCVAALDITTVVGRGLNQMLVAPFINQDSFSSIGIESSTENNILGVLGVGALGVAAGAIFASGGAIAVAVLGAMLPLILTISLIALAVLFTLVIRQGLLIFLTVISPVAIACYVLPGTEKYFRQWLDLFTKTLMVYPIIAVIFAMSNVLGAILLTSAGGSTSASMVDNFNRIAQTQAGSPDGIATIQIIAAVLVLYAPLVLIPFAFKLAGGAIAAVANAASGRASSFAGRAGQAIQKNRQDPNSWLGRGKNRAQGNRREKGWTPGQVMSGLNAGRRAARRGESFRAGYSAGSGTLGRSQNYANSDAVLESEAVKAISGNDDSVYAWNFGRNEAHVRQILGQRGYKDKDLDEATAMVMRAKGQGSTQVNKMASVRAQAKTGTGWEDSGQMSEDIIQASGGDKNVMGRLLAESRGSALQAGRVDEGIASFNEQFKATARMMDAQSGGAAYTREQATADITSSAIDSAQAGQMMYGKPASARAFAQGWNRRLQQQRANLRQSEQNLATNDTAENRELLQAAKQDVKKTMASIASIQDAAGSAPAQNAREISNELLGTELKYQDLSAAERDVFGAAFQASGVQEKAVVGKDGVITMEKVQVTGHTDQPITLAQGLEGMRSDADFATMRRELNAQQQQMQLAQPSGGVGAGGAPPGAAPPGGLPGGF